ncbi:MAG: helicase-related protein, partial [Chthoniobacterales bacterium]|nr:helicase-related protein [Chthoniobacterales bacterium]
RSFRYFLNSHNFVIIFDECHICGGDGTHNNKILKAARTGGAKIILISATVADKPTKLDAIGYALGLHDGSFNGFKKFLLSVGGRYNVTRYGTEWTFNMDMACKSIRRLIFETRKGLRKVAEEIAEIPDNQIIVEFAELNGQTVKINEIYENLERRIQELQFESSSSIHILAEITKSLQAVELQKIAWLEDAIKNDIEEGMSVCVFMNYRESVETLSKALMKNGIEACVMTGETSTEERTKLVCEFQDDKKRVFISTTAAGGAGISLHDVRGQFPRISYIMPSFNSIHIKQALGRAGGRAGGKTKSITKIVFVKDTPEEKQGLALEQKINFIDSLNDGDLKQGFSFAKFV